MKFLFEFDNFPPQLLEDYVTADLIFDTKQGEHEERQVCTFLSDLQTYLAKPNYKGRCDLDLSLATSIKVSFRLTKSASFVAH